MPKKTAKTPDISKQYFIEEQKITDTLEWNYMPYAMSVIVSRAIPEIDGFKPSHRKLLYTMFKMNLLKGDRTKSSNVVGQTMKLNPHGDSAIYETLVRLTEGNGALLLPFVDSKGNFGKQYSRDMAYAAPRYTEVKLASVCQEIFADIDKNTVTFVDNYDGSMKEPLLLPTTFPNILVNPNLGIAVGMASSICSFNLKEVCKTTIQLLKNENADILSTLHAPDFPTGGQLIYNENELKSIYETGRGNVKVRAKYRYDEKNNCIEIYEIPYTTNIEAIMDKIFAIVKSGKIRDITDVRDETDLNGLKITIDVKRNTKADLLMHRLYQMTPLSDTFNCNFNILIDSKPMTLGVRSILKYWIDFRIGSIKNQLEFDITKKSEKYHLLIGLSKILMDIDKAISIIRHTEKEDMVVPNLMNAFSIDEKQSEYIAEIKLRNINKEYILKRTEELDTLKQEIQNLKDILNSEQKIKDVIASQLKQVIKKYGQDRKTEIISEDDIEEIPEHAFIEDYGIRLFLTEQNYFKKISLVSLRSAGEQKLKEDDKIIFEIEATNKADILLFSNKQNLYKLKANDVTDTKASSFGEYLFNVLGMEQDEKIIYMTTTYDYSGFMVFFFDNGKVAKVQLASYATKTNRKKIINAYSNKANILFMKKLEEDADFVLIRDADKALLFHTSLLPLTASKNGGGIQVYKLKKYSCVTNIFEKETFVSDDVEYYRTQQIPTAGHFMQVVDKQNNSIA